MVHESSALSPPGIPRGKRYSVISGKEFITYGLANCIFYGGIHDSPSPHCCRTQISTGLFFRLQLRDVCPECVVKRIFLARWIRQHIDLLHGIAPAIELEIEPHVEEMLMVRSVEEGAIMLPKGTDSPSRTAPSERTPVSL